MLRYGKRWMPPGGFAASAQWPQQATLDAQSGEFLRYINSMVDPEHFDRTWRQFPTSENFEDRPPMTPEEQQALTAEMIKRVTSPGTVRDPVPDAPGWEWVRQGR